MSKLSGAKRDGDSGDAGPVIRPVEPRDLSWVREELGRCWGGVKISSRGRWFEADGLSGFIAEIGGERVGLATHTRAERSSEMEVVTLSSRTEDSGVGTSMLEACVMLARRAGCTRVFLTTSNDNLRALGFYQKRGWRLVAVHRGAMDEARKVRPTIPLVGMNGIPLRDEIELEMRL